jgi:hypothetical protein
MNLASVSLAVIALFTGISSAAAAPQTSSGSAGTVHGNISDPSSAAVPGATVTIENPISHYSQTAQTDTQGTFQFVNVPFNNYHIIVSKEGFAARQQDVDVRSPVAVDVKIQLALGTASTSVVVTEAADLVETESTTRTDVDRGLFNKLPLESQSSSLSSLVTLASPGVAADSNGLFHGLGDHAENSFSIDGQPITDQQSKVFSNQLPVDAVQSLEVIEGAPPPEFGGKTSLVIVATTRSGLGVSTPRGDVTASYGTFGTTNAGFDLSYGGPRWGNFISANGLDTGRFLDPPEFTVLHDKGNQENLFDRLDFKPSDADTFSLNLQFTRSWFQTPNTWDQQLQTCTVLSAMCSGAPYAPGSVVLNPLTGNPLGPTDQRSQIRTFDIAPKWTHVLNAHTVLTVGAFVRHDQYNYYPSPDPFSDLGPLQDETFSQFRTLTNAGIHADVNYVKGIHNIKVGGTFEHTFLTENDTFGIVNPGLLAGCTSAACVTLQPYDLTNPATDPNLAEFPYHGHTDIKEESLYAVDNISKGPWSIMIGFRADFYNGLQASSKQPEPRAGVGYHINKTGTMLRVSYARTMESPFNENLIVSGTGCTVPAIAALMQLAQGFPCGEVSPSGATLPLAPLSPGFRNEFHAGLEQAFGKHFVLSGEYIWKYTHNGYDFNILGTSPITLPIEWHNSKIPGYAVRGSFPTWHGLTAFIVMSSVAARFFPPTVSGIAPPQPPGVFRIDHDELFNQTTHIQYQPFQRGPWLSFNWRYDSGLVSGTVPCLAATATCSFSTGSADSPIAVYSNVPVPQGDVLLQNNATGLPLTADQEFESGLSCGGVKAGPTTPIGTPVAGFPGFYTCPANQLTSSIVKIPAPGTENDDHNPQRILPRNLFDLALGHDNIFHGERYKWSARIEVINLTNKVAVYNFLSTFSGTHYVTPRTVTATIGFHF